MGCALSVSPRRICLCISMDSRAGGDLVFFRDNND